MLDFLLKDTKYNNYKVYLLITYFLWLVSLFAYVYFSEFVKAGGLENGVKLGKDSTWYINESIKIINGKSSILEHKTHFGYLIFLIPFLYFELPLYFVVLFQILLTSVSAFCLYKISEKYFCKLSGVLSVALFLLYFPLQIRNFFILTDMLFINVSILLCFFIVYFKKKNLLILITLLIFIISIRPNGMLFLFSILLSSFLFLIKNKRYLYISLYITLLLILAIPVINFLNSYLNELNLIRSLNKGIIWGYSFETNNICEDLCLSVELVNKNYPNTLYGFIQFVSINFIEFFKIFFQKIFWMIARIRPYYSDLHNFYIMLFNIVIYSSFIYGFVKKPKYLYSLHFINFYILFTIILIGLTFADWSGRFSLYIFPFLMVFSSYGILIFIKKILNMIK